MPTKEEVEAYLTKNCVNDVLQKAISELVQEGMPDNPLLVLSDKLRAAATAATEEVRDRTSLWAALHAASSGDAEKVKACLCAYTPPAERLIIRSDADFATLGTSKEAVHGACDPSFWAFGDFESVHQSFALDEADKERRVMGVEGVGSPEALLAIIESGAKSLKIGHLSLPMMQGKVANGEWRWIDEARCVMHTATPKPALLRVEVLPIRGLEARPQMKRHVKPCGSRVRTPCTAGQVRARLGLELRVVRHEEFAQGSESAGDLIIFDMDKADVEKETGNTKVFCQDPSSYKIAPFDGLADEMKAAVDRMLALQLKPKGA